MQSKTTRGVRHLLVSTGVISLVLSVAAPAALADRPEDLPGKGQTHADNETTGTTRVLVCHHGAVLEVDDDGGDLGGHAKHGDELLGPVGEDISAELQLAIDACTATTGGEALEGGHDLVELCLDGLLVEVSEAERTHEHMDPVLSESEELTCPEEVVVGGDTVEVCHEGSVIEIAVEALEEHRGHGDVDPDGEAAPGEECGDTDTVIVEEPIVIVEPVVVDDLDDPVVLDDPEVVVEVPVEHPPAAPDQPIPAPQPRAVVSISNDAVARPVVATPAATPKAEQNEVLGAVITRTPTPGVGALDPGAHTAASITALAATGADGTKVLAVAGVALLLSGFGLQVSGRRRMRSAVVEA